MATQFMMLFYNRLEFPLYVYPISILYAFMAIVMMPDDRFPLFNPLGSQLYFHSGSRYGGKDGGAMAERRLPCFSARMSVYKLNACT